MTATIQTIIGQIEPNLPGSPESSEPAQRDWKPERYPLNYDTDGLHPSVNEAHRAVQWWLNDIIHRETSRRRMLTLYGKSGSGKTHLARNAVNVLKSEGRTAQFWPWRKALSRMLDGEWELMGHLCRLPILALDDVGTEFTGTDKTRRLSNAKLYELIDERCGKWTLITSNLSPGDLADETDVRIASRLFRGNNVLIDMSSAEDYCFKRWKEGKAQR
ncbi:MAG: hypothetical protein LUE08_07330 [Akkermansiaceae bacterium]|nr:hypothetical protein [Akkermansiaceae bacterium]